MLELTVISAQGIKSSSSSFSLFSHHLKPFITITSSSSSSSSSNSIKPCRNCHVYSTKVDDEGGPNPTWGDKFLLPLDHKFFSSTNNYSCIYLQLFTKRALLGPTLLGWIRIPVCDIFDAHFPLGLTHHLSYRLRKRDGSKGNGVINVSCKFLGQLPVTRQRFNSGEKCLPEVDTWQIVTGWPMKMRCRGKRSDG
ncbi:unnamed protein product [Amaranthus hypochondriacus]